MQRTVDIDMDCPEVKVDTTAEEQLEPLFILEEGDEVDNIVNNREKGRGLRIVKKDDERDIEKAIEGRRADGKDIGKERGVHEEGREKTECRTDEEGKIQGGKEGEDLGGGTEDIEEKDKMESDGPETNNKRAAQTEEGMEMKEMPAKEKDGGIMKTDTSREDTQLTTQKRSKDTLSPEDAQKEINRLTPDFPDALYELLFTLQEGRRLNDQRCSFRMEGRRRCYSEPSTPRHSQKVVFSSMTSLQKEEFFDLVATSQGRRLDDQRAELQDIPPASSPPQPKPKTELQNIPLASPPQPKTKDRKSSCKGSEFNRATPSEAPKEELYNMILTSQAQGRLEEQRSSAPGPMDDEDFFSLLLRVQGGRMDEQRTELPI